MPPARPQPQQAPGTVQEQMDRASAWDNYHAWHDKAEAYTKAATLVTEARRIEQDSQDTVLDVLGGMADTGPLISMTDAVIGVAAASATQQTDWRADAKAFTQIADNAQAVAGDRTQPSAYRAHVMVNGLIARVRAQIADTRANTNHVGRWLERLPEPVQRSLNAQLKSFIPRNATYLAKAPEVLKKISVAGGVLSAAATVNEIYKGKDPATVIVSNGSGLIAGTAAGMAVGGPFGALGAFIIGTGTTIVVDHVLTPDPEDKHTIAPGPTAHYPRQGG